ncbi:uncharacterized protein LOC112085316 [Eutrema salsugineum]|uniref:uncharacterized protein LOC112085316 n=1 Tax=Eutrema salsugineum TaxID=72664 RepID=UPI000CED3E91|nr:uncharacterized protein LOC112085316 [Eutrema salsugineum]
MSRDIGFHPNTTNSNVTHLAFADDIMVFFDGGKHSLESIAATLESFSQWSGLSMNHSKTELFKGGMNQIETAELSSLGFSYGCLKKIESMCSRFLWSGDISKKSVAKVSWYNVCLPKEEGGLGLRNFQIWNKTLCLRLIWFLFSNSSSLWLVSFWWDHWTPLGPLIDLFGTGGPRELVIPLQASVSQACNSSGWLRLVAHATIYGIWRERNKRINDNISSTLQAIFKFIDRLIRDAILAKRKRKAFGDLMQIWLTFS